MPHYPHRDPGPGVAGLRKAQIMSSTTYSALFEVRQHLPNQFRATLSQSGSLKRAGPVRADDYPGHNAFEPYPRPARGERRGNARIRAPRFREHCALAALEPLNLPAPAFPGGGLRDRHHNSQGLPGGATERARGVAGAPRSGRARPRAGSDEGLFLSPCPHASRAFRVSHEETELGEQLRAPDVL